MPEDNPNNDALANAIRRGLEMAMGSPDIQRAIANMVDRSERSSKDSPSRQGTGFERDISIARDILAKKSAKVLSDLGAPGLSDHASVASNNADQAQSSSASQTGNANGIQSRVDQTNAARASRGFLGNVAAGFRGDDPQRSALSDRPYQVMPPSFGQFAGQPSVQSFFQMIGERNREKMGTAQTQAELEKYISRGRRANFISNEVIPVANAVQKYGGQAYRMLQAQSDLGATQIGGAPVGGNIEFGGVGFRFPINNAAMQGLGIKFHQMGQALGAGINMEQMQNIDNTLFGMGFNFNDRRFMKGERALENIVKYNPTVNTKLAAQQMEYSVRYGTNEQVAMLAKTIEGLGATAAGAGVSTQELQAQMLEYTTQAEKMGGLSAQTAQDAGYLQRTMPGMDPNTTMGLLRNNPMGQQAVMSMGYMPYQIGAMSGQEMRKATFQAMAGPWKSLTGLDINNTSKEFLQSHEGKLAIASMQELYKFDIDADQMANLIGNKKQSERMDRVESKYFKLDARGNIVKEKGQSILKGLDIQKHTENRDAMSALGGFLVDQIKGDGGDFSLTNRYETTNRKDLDRLMRDMGLRGKKADEFRASVTDYLGDGKYKLDKNFRKKVEEKITQLRSDQDQPTNDFNKLIKATEQMKQAAIGLKNAQSKGAFANGSNPASH